MLFNIAMEQRCTAVTKSMQILTRSFFCSSAEKLGDPSRRLLHKPQFVMQDVVHGTVRNPMGSSQVHAGDLAVGLHVTGDNNDNVQSSLSFYLVQVPLIVGVLPALIFFRML
jgi:hypothetical protein